MTAATTTAVPAGPYLRPWQVNALRHYLTATRRDYLLTATPGAGKTTFALTAAARLLHHRAVQRVIVVAPTDHLRTQWADAAAAFGIWLDPDLPNSVGPVRDGTHGYVTTYAQVAAKPLLHRRRTETRTTLVIIDEIHHASDGLTWGAALRDAFDPAKHRLALTGTPFRTKPDERIPFITYEADDDQVTSVADFTYSYHDALTDQVVRPVMFAAYTGTSRWTNNAGDAYTATLGSGTRSDEDKAWRTALSPTGRWVPHVIAAIYDRIQAQRGAGVPDAAGIILANDQDTARAYAHIAHTITGTEPVLVVSDDPGASDRLTDFTHGNQELVVCVRMISEGVDIPRATTLGYLCSARTPLFFAQAIGRVVRARSPEETATVFLPAVRPLLELAAAMETERNTVLQVQSRDDHDMTPNLTPQADAGGGWVAIDAEAQFAHVLSAGRAITGNTLEVNPDDMDFLGLPGLLTPEQMAVLLAARDAEHRRQASAASTVPEAPGTWRDTGALRREIHRLVAVHAARTGRPHGQVHAALRTAVPGPATAVADTDTLQARRDLLLGLVG